MVKWLDEKLASNGLAQHAIKTKNARVLLVEAAKACVGIREATNRNDGPMVELIQSTVGGSNREAWCLSFVQTMVAYVELRSKLVSRLEAACALHALKQVSSPIGFDSAP